MLGHVMTCHPDITKTKHVIPILQKQNIIATNSENHSFCASQSSTLFVCYGCCALAKACKSCSMLCVLGSRFTGCLAVQGSMDSYASAAERQSSFTNQTSSQPDSFRGPLTVSRPDSFVSASAASFPASRLNSVTAGSRPDAPDTVLEMPNSEQAQMQG